MSEKKVFAGNRAIAWWRLKKWKRRNEGKIEILSQHDLHGHHCSDDCYDDNTYYVVYYRRLPQEEPKRLRPLFDRIVFAIFPLTPEDEAEMRKLPWPRRIVDAIFPTA